MEIININEVISFVTKDGSIIKEVFSPLNSFLNNQSLAEATLLPGKATKEHYHCKSEEIYYVLQGKGKIKIEEEIREVKPKDGIVILPGKKHKIWNTGERKLIFLCCCSPAYSHEDTTITE